MSILQKTLRWIKRSPLKLAIVILLLVILGVRISQKQKNAEAPVQEVKPSVHSLVSTLANADGFMNLTCSVEAAVDIEITPEIGGTVTSVKISDGDSVRKGQTLFTLENLSERISMQDAKVALESAKLTLEELVNDSGENGTVVSQTTKQQAALVESSRNALFNNDLRAYPKDDPQNADKSGPTISGNYTCETEGAYVIEVYASSADSGASFRASGLEKGTSSVSTAAFGTNLGDCGLDLSFSEGFDKNQTWIIPVPNLRSSSYTSALKSYEATLQTKNLAVDQASASPQKVKQKQSQIDQANLRYQLAVDSYSKTIIRAQNSGTISSFTLDSGDFVYSGSPVGSLKTSDDLELVTYIAPSEKVFITIDSGATVSGEETVITTLSGSIDSKTKKTRITLAAPKDLQLTEGTQLGCSIKRTQITQILSGGGIIVPLSAISVIGTDPHVFFVDEENKAVAEKVTLGSILGETIITYGISAPSILRDARGVSTGTIIEIKE